MKFKNLFLIFIVLIILLSCVYYNTFYNAQNYFEQAKAKSLKDNGRPTTQAISLYNKSMKKCGIVITDYKNSKYADDALFLLAKCLYYKQNYMLAKEQFDNFIKKYPNNKLLPEAILFSAKSDFFLGNKQKAYTKLAEFLINNKMKKYHPKAYLTLSEYYFQDKLYKSSEKYLQDLLDKYPNSEEYEEAFFRLGEIYHISKDYKKSSDIFTKFLKKRFSRNKKLDARYYIAYNNIMLNNPELAIKQIKKLLKDEYREEKISKIRLIEAQANAGLGKYKLAETEFRNIIHDNPHKKISATASYFLANMYFQKLHDYKNAIEYYNKVKSNYRKSKYVKDALSKSNIASQILQYNSSNDGIEAKELVKQSFKLADYYLNILNMPDSSLVVYDQIINNRNVIKSKIDSLKVKFSAFSDSINSPDSTTTIRKDSLKISINNFKETLNLYDNNFIPLSYFLKLWVYKTVKHDSTNSLKVFKILKKQYPSNKYFFAAQKLINGEPVDEIIAPQEKEIREKYDKIIEKVKLNPDSSIIKLKSLEIPETSELYWKKIFSLGFIYYYDLKDTISAKKYFNQILENLPKSEYYEYINKFYNGNHFTVTDSLPYLNSILKKEKAKTDTVSKNDSQ